MGDKGDLIVFDGHCVFCSGFARFMAKRDKRNHFRFVTAQSETGRALYHAHNLDPDVMDTNIVILNGKAHIKMQAFAAAVSVLPWPWRWAAVLGRIPNRLSDPAYDWIARNRYHFGRQACLIPTPALKTRLIE